MTFVDFVLYWVAPIIALVYVFGYSYLFAPIRQWRKWPKVVYAFFDCPMCIGAWVGAAVGAINSLPFIGWKNLITHIVLGGCLAVAVEYVLEVFGRE
jgi:hypothetical protein